MIRLIIFSKDRPMQLQLLLDSLDKYAPGKFNTMIIVKWSNSAYEKAYKQVNSKVTFLPETNLQYDVKLAVASSGRSKICFMVDDDVMFKEMPEIPDLKKNEVFSLRGSTDYPLSLDGHIFNFDDIVEILNKIKYNNPNKMEAAMQKFKNKFTAIMDYQCLVGIPHNRVSNKSHCSFTGKFDEKDLNKRFLKGKRIKLDEMDFSKVKNIHEDIDYVIK